MTGGRLDLLLGLGELRRVRQIHLTSGTTGRDGIMGVYTASKQIHSEDKLNTVELPCGHLKLLPVLFGHNRKSL